jgi:type 1 glutamine amidotransferase
MRSIDGTIRHTAVIFLAAAFLAASAVNAKAATPDVDAPRFRVVAIAEPGGIHLPFVVAAKAWLNQLAEKNHFAVDYIEDTERINDQFLSRYQLFIQLNYPPYRWTPTAQAAFIKYIEEGRGGWIGFHHAGLLGEFDGYQMWPWFSRFMGGIRFTNYIATFVDGVVTVEDKSHPAMKGLPTSFKILREEFYTWDKSPRPKVHVLASVNENSFSPDTKIKMGDHPVIWTNEHYKARNIYIFMGHHADLFENSAFTTIFRNSIFWAAHQTRHH